MGVFRLFCACATAAAFILYSPVPARADINELQPLDLGRWVVTRNDNQFQIIVNTDGSYSNSPQLIMIEPPQQGVYQITDLPPFTPINSVTFTLVAPLSYGGQTVTLDSFQYLIPTTDGAGETTLTVGLRARTSGNNQGYEDGTYSGTLDVDINL